MNKKIGILTQPLINNYGGILQAYALTTVLSEMGYNVEIIDRKFDSLNDSPIKKMLKIFIKKYFLKRINPDILYVQDIVSNNTLKFIKENISLSCEKYFSSNIMNINNHGYGVIIVGSDQVWRPRYSPCITNYFLDFCQNSKHLKKIAYSASFGVSNWEFTDKKTQLCASLAKQFDAISVREDSAINLCRRYLGVDAVHTLDPTLLLDKKYYIALVKKYNEPQNNDDLMYYMLDNSQEKEKIIALTATIMNLSPFTIMPAKSLNNERYDKNKYHDFEYPRLTQWLRGFMDAKYIITDSFHGCVFSIIFNKPFIVIGNRDRGLARFDSLLKTFELEDRLIFNLSELTKEKLTYQFDWQKINNLKLKTSAISIDFLKNGLA